jgi:pimeloyl-ACP methyl ester carboxylesterase
MTTYVLVHGAWHGGWCWRMVRAALEAGGADVYTPTLTGLGERAHLASRDIALETHVGDVLGVLETEDLSDVVLVGHSYSGMVVTAVADRAAARIARLIYLDAVVPRDGQCVYDCLPAQRRTQWEEQARVAGEGWRVPVATPKFLGLKDEKDIRWVMPKLTPHPIRTFRETVRLSARFPQLSRTYIKCIGEIPLEHPRTIRADGIEDYHEVRTGHDAMVTAPQDIAALLARSAKSVGAQPRAAGDTPRAARP